MGSEDGKEACCVVQQYSGTNPSKNEAISIFEQAGQNQLGNSGPSLPLYITSGCPANISPSCPSLQNIPPFVPSQLLKIIGYWESEGYRCMLSNDYECDGWRQFDVDKKTLLSKRGDCGYGIMQITSNMGCGEEPNGFDRERVSYDWIYNIGTGALFLINKWKSIPYYIGENDPRALEDWYYAVWAYNSGEGNVTVSSINNPNNPIYAPNRPPADSDDFDPSLYKYPYQEIIWGYANNPPAGKDGNPLWERIQLILPDRSLFKNTILKWIARPGAPESIFIDVPKGYWAESYINAIYNAHITVGCSQNPLKYCPQDFVPREQMAAFLVRAVEGEPPLNYCDSASPFTDVTPDMWSCGYIKRLKELGITKGYGDGRYGPYDFVPREQMAAFLARAFLGMGSAPQGKILIVLSPENAKDSLWTMSPDGSGKNEIRLDDYGFLYGISISPDEKTFALPYRGGIFILNTSGEKLNTLAFPQEMEYLAPEDLRWSPDGTKIVFDAPDEWDIVNYNIYAIHIETGDLVRLTQPRENELNLFPTWTPDSKQIIFNRFFAGNDQYKTYVINADGTGQEKMIKDLFFPAFSPDGTKLAFVDPDAKVSVGTYKGFNEDIEITDIKQLADFVKDDSRTGAIKWSPDGKRIAFTDGYGEIFVINSDGSSSQEIPVDTECHLVEWVKDF